MLFPLAEDLPDTPVVSRFLAKIALEAMALLTCHWFVTQRRLEPQPVLRRVARG